MDRTHNNTIETEILKATCNKAPSEYISLSSMHPYDTCCLSSCPVCVFCASVIVSYHSNLLRCEAVPSVLEDHSTFIIRDQVTMKVLRSSEKRDLTHPMTHRHITEDLNPLFVLLFISLYQLLKLMLQ